MTRTVDVAIAGSNTAAVAAAIDAVNRGMRVLLVSRTRSKGLVRRLRRSLRAAGELAARQVTVMTGAEVVCVDGVNAVEAVVVRRLRTGQLVGFNASAWLAFEEPGREPASRAILGAPREVRAWRDRSSRRR